MEITDQAMQKRMMNRLSRIEGQVRGVKKLIEQSNDCEKVMQQMSAVRRAMDKAFYEVLACVIEQEVVNDSAGPSEDSMARVKALLTKYS